MDTSKIIKGVVNSGRYTVTAPIVKEDYGLYLQIEGVELPQTYEVDFSNSENSGTSVTMIGNSDGVLIPHQFIDTGKDIFAFLYHVGANYGRTVYKFRIPNKVRPDRTDETPTPEEQSVIDQCISALNEAVAQIAGDVESASQSAQSAESAKTAAESARDTAGEYANDAESSAASASTSASQASTSATASAQSASQSAQIKSDVEGMVDDAQGYAQASERSASASANSASQAQGYAQSASASAQSASGYASNAQSYSQTASAKATESAQSASQALTYKTDAESAKTASQTAQGLAESARDSAVQAKTDAESAKADAESARDEAQQAVASISGALADKAPIITDTALGSIASFTDGADDLPLKSLVIDINPVQDLSHGDPSPENICPISGWTQVGVEQSGVNVWDEEWEVGSINNDTGANAANNTVIRSKNYIPVMPNTQYYFTTTVGYAFQYDDSKNYIGILPQRNTTPTASNCRYLRFRLDSAYGTTYNHDISINYPSTDHDYHPYTGRSINIDLGQTVYGGKLDVLSGELTIDRAMVDLGTLVWRYYEGETNIPVFYARNEGMRISQVNTALCSMFKATSWQALTIRTDKTVCPHPSIDYIYVADSDYENATEFTDAVSGQQYCYKLATPITIQLTPNQVNSLLGVNNIWADSGDTEAVYRADTKLFIERLTAPDSADMIADANITSGKYFMVGNSLYKATANIANGSAIIVGTNCIRKSLSEALNEINA